MEDHAQRAVLTRAIALYLTDLAVTTPLDSHMITWALEGTAGSAMRLQVRFLVDPDALIALAGDVEAMDAIEALQRRMRAGHVDPDAPNEPPRTLQAPRDATHDDLGQDLTPDVDGDERVAGPAPSTDDVVTALMPYICGTCTTRWPTPQALRGHRRLVHGAH